MPEIDVPLTTIEAYLGDKRRRLTFPPALEEIYFEQTQPYRRKLMSRGLLPTVLIYNIFLIADFYLLPQTFLLSAALHFLAVTPALVAIFMAYPAVSTRWLRETVTAAIPILIVTQIMLIYALNRGTGADHYQYLAALVVVYMNVNLHFGFRLAIASTLAIVAIYLGILLPGNSPFEVKFVGAAVMLTTAYMSLMAYRRTELDVRYNFLRRTRERLLREGAEEVSMLDALTGVANRRQMEKRARKLWEDAGESMSNLALIMIDIDYFKPYNDRYGHVAGDNCLKRIAGVIAAEKRNDADLAVRYGGEEFLVLLPETDLAGAMRMAERIRRHIENLAIPNEGNALDSSIVTASLGVTSGPMAMHSFSELLTSADSALYAAKRNGRNQVWPPFIASNGPVAILPPSPVRNSKAG